ncbi:MFS transporter [Flavobacterium sp. SUN052]|uniref:MFS transporter n=1 Tax=Flavobacterium sp. SUN052 TaxID=3002441 RepID=UPI00237D4CA3|nr:MFS transporter [Flavobacterium sp. SUN052]MEC4003953.1 MFS transporter [Flavobacterium sp. SUN052]
MPLIDYSFLSKILPKVKYKKSYTTAKQSYLNRIRWAVSLLYFGMGLCFATWASRIPVIKSALHLSEGQLGSILFALPVGQLLAMPFSGKLVNRFGSHKVLAISLFFYVIGMISLGLASEGWHLALGLFVYGLFGNFCNIAVNTQGVYTEELFKKTLMGSFHGSWSLAGFVGALVGLIMLYFNITTVIHFCIMAVLIMIILFLNYNYLIKVKSKNEVTEEKKGFIKPDSGLIWLGVIGFCCMASEGVMFDWSGVYFKEIVKAPGALVILGYTSFMVMMATGRFVGDKLIHKYGAKTILQISGSVISIGLFLAVLFPYLIPCTLSFMLVGIGVSSVVPTVYSLAGKNTSVSTSSALTIVSSVSFLGFLMGPPLIGYVAEMTSLKYSFGLIGCFGVFITLLVSRLKLFR